MKLPHPAIVALIVAFLLGWFEWVQRTDEARLDAVACTTVHTGELSDVLADWSACSEK